MSNQNEILNSEEVEFLLEASSQEASPASAPASSANTQVATMRGDLEHMPLADIFQTLGLTKMEGILKVSNPIEQRLVHFHDGIVRIVVPPRTATRRLGQRLVQAGVLAPENLRLALLEQRKDHKPLGELLILGGYVSREQVDDVVAMQVTEELFGLFTWEHGEFEFYKGPPQDPALAERLATCPEFEINSLLLEVARRSDEWESILASLGSLDEIPIPIADAASAELDETHRTVLVAIDGKHTYRELGDITVLSVFDAARAARDLMDQGLIQVASDDQILDVAKYHLEQSHAKMAVLLAQRLRDRGQARSVAMVREIAGVLRRANESALACEVLLEAAQLQGDATIALELAQEALAMNPRDLGAQSFLRTTMMAHLSPESPEVEAVTLALLDGLLIENDLERVFTIVDETRQLECCTPPVMVREARALAKRKDRDGAVQRLLEAAAIYEQRGDSARQVEILELAFRLDRDRRDIHKTLRALRSTPRTRAVKYGAIAAVLTMVAAVGLVWFMGRLRADRLMNASTQVTALLGERKIAEALEALNRWEESLGECPEVDDLRSQVRFAEATELQRRQKDAMRAAADRMQTAGELALDGKLDQAFAIYEEMAKDEAVRKAADEAATARVAALLRDLQDAEKHLPPLLPQPPNDLTEPQQVEETLTLLRRHVPVRLRDAARALQQLVNGPGLPIAIPTEKRQELARVAVTAGELLERGTALLRAYEDASARSDQQRRLDPLFKSALQAERELDFQKALVAYRQLAAAGAGTDKLRSHFTGKVRELEGIVGILAAITTATAAGDFGNANRDFQALCLAHPQVPFQQIVRLPVRIVSSVPGARLRWNGSEVGTTPQLVSYSPGSENTLELRLQRFEPVRLQLPFNHNGRVDVVLTLRAEHVIEIDANIDQALAIGSNGSVYGVDRAGSVLAFDPVAGKVIWTVRTGDSAGYLSPPLLYRDAVLVGSLDGRLRALSRADGALLWERPELPTEFAPTLLDGRLAIATGQHIELLEPSSGEPLGRIELPAAPRADLAGAGSELYVVLGDNTVVAVDVKDQTVMWHSSPGDLGQMLAVTGRGVLALRDDGNLALVDPRTGKPIWQRELQGTPTGRPSVAGDRALVTFDDRALMLDVADGKETWTATRPADGWLGAARFLGDLIAVPTRGGSILVFTAGEASPRYRLPADRNLSICGDGRDFVLVSTGRSLALYRRLP